MLVLFFLRPAVSLDFDFDLIWVFWKQSQQLSRLTAALILIVGLVHVGFISLILAEFRHGRLRPAAIVALCLLGLQWRAIRLDAVCTFLISSSRIECLGFALLFCGFFFFPSDNFFGVGCVCLVCTSFKRLPCIDGCSKLAFFSIVMFFTAPFAPKAALCAAPAACIAVHLAL